MSDTAGPSYDDTKLNIRLRSFEQEPSVVLLGRVNNPSIRTGRKGFKWRGSVYTVEQGESGDFERPGDLIKGFSKTVTADDLWEPVCTIESSSSSVDLSEHTKVCFVGNFSNTVLVPPSVRKCVVTSSSSEITLQGDRNVIVVGGSSNTVVATSGRVIEIPKNMIPMDVGSLVVTQDGEVFGGTQVFVSNFSNTINVLGDDNLVFDTGALPLLSLLRLVTQRDPADFAGEIWGGDDPSNHKQTFTLGLLGALVKERQRDPSVLPKAGSSWSQVTADVLNTQEPTAVANLKEMFSATKYSEEGQIASAKYDSTGYKGQVTVEWTVDPGKNSESPDERNDQSVTSTT